MTAITRKLLREMLRLKGQIFTIALVLAGGMACFIALRGTVLSLDDARDEYYDRYRFAHVFARVKRAPEFVASRIEALPGVEAVETRIVEEVSIPIEGMARPAWGQVVSLPQGREPATNALCMVRGRVPEHGRDEVVVLDAFARAHGLEPGHRIPVVVNGKERTMVVTGIALSPEFIYVIRPGAMIDDPARVAVLWMNRSTLATAFDLDGAFDDVSVRLQPGADVLDVRAAVDRILAPYGSDGSVARDRQTSNYILTSELAQLRGIAGMVPIVFLGVAAFLINMVLGRMISLQRPEIATLKAVGYTDREIARHYLGLVTVVMLPGALLGVIGGFVLGRAVLALYGTVFRFAELRFVMSFGLVAGAVLVSAVSAVAGALLAVRSAVRLPPAEAMRPPAPPRYRRGLLERLGLSSLLGPVGMMIVREQLRRPLRTALSAIGIAGAIALIVLGHFGIDSLEQSIDERMRREQRQDLGVTFRDPLGPRALAELAHLPGVTHVEGTRAVAVRAKHEQRERDAVLLGLPRDSSLRRVIDVQLRAVAAPERGVMVTRTLADVLGLTLGDAITLELREGERRTVRPVIVALVDEAFGLQVYGSDATLSELEGDEGAFSGALLSIDRADRSLVEDRLRRSPAVIDVSDLDADIDRLQDMNGSMMDVWTAVSVSLSACVIFGVVYNNARIALTMRSRELASLRVLGMTRREISTILIGSLASEIALAIPLGIALGKLWSNYFMSTIDQEMYRWPAVVAPRTYLMAAATAVLAGAASALWVRRSLDHLDLIAVLKTRE